jgi:hypothetical protein
MLHLCNGGVARKPSAKKPHVAPTALFRGLSNSFGYRKTHGLIEIMDKGGRLRQSTMSAVQGSADLSINILRRLIEKTLKVR